jgi:hypothetical protein
MANTPKVLYRGAASTTVGTILYTVPSATATVITSIIVSNTATTTGTYTLALDGVLLASAVTVPGSGFVTLDLRQVLGATKSITGGANATTINFHISGMESA